MLTPHRILQNPRLLSAREKILLNLPFWLAAGLAALISVFYNKLFKVCEDWALAHAATTTILWTAPLAVLASFLIGYFVSKESIGSGIPQVIAAVESSSPSHTDGGLLKRFLSFPMLLAKIVGSCLCVLGGGVTGREGPTLQVSAAIFYQFSRFWPKRFSKPQLQGMILAGGAAGLASAFNTPLGGVVFAIEELSKSHISAIRTAVFQSVIIAGILAQLFLGNYLYLGDTKFGSFPVEVLFQTILIAAIVGVVGSAFAETLYRVTKWRGGKSLFFKVSMTLLCGLLLSLTIWALGPVTVGAGKTFMSNLLQNPDVVASPLTPAARILGNLFTYVGGVIGGVFAPSLASGAALGQYLAQLMGFTSVKLMILVGMVAFLTGITRTPFTSFILVLEMSNSHEVILYLMLASVIANVCSRIVNTHGFYEQAAHDIIEAQNKV
jgi:chloride channel protein, CIC family